jgi:two-component system, chemotaxis family, response regulator Rcp1
MSMPPGSIHIATGTEAACLCGADAVLAAHPERIAEYQDEEFCSECSAIYAQQTKRHILLIEDNPADAHLFKQGLRELGSGHSVEVAADGEQALKVLRDPEHSCPDLIVLDLNLPRLSGHEVLTELRSIRTLADIPVLILSSSAQDRDRAQAFSNGANEYLTKPCDIDEYLHVLTHIERRWLRDQRAAKSG